ncbi:UNVERIFIED_CONTAM: hypothetical protein Sindi_2408500 [Sesamum indicum]
MAATKLQDYKLKNPFSKSLHSSRALVLLFSQNDEYPHSRILVSSRVGFSRIEMGSTCTQLFKWWKSPKLKVTPMAAKKSRNWGLEGGGLSTYLRLQLPSEEYLNNIFKLNKY